MADVIGCTPIQLEKGHAKEMEALVKRLPKDAAEGNEPANESSLERFEKLVQLYSDEPQLLDPILPEMVNSLLGYIELPSWTTLGDGVGPCRPTRLTLAAMDRLRILIRTRGYKVVVRLLPHEVSYMEPVLAFLEHYASQCVGEVPSQPGTSTLPTSSSSSETDRRVVYVLAVWLFILCKNPFSLARFNPRSAANPAGNTQAVAAESMRTLAERLVATLNVFMKQYAPLGEMRIVSTLLAQLLTRPSEGGESVRQSLRPIVEKCLEAINSLDSEDVDGGRELIANLQLLISIFKWGQRRVVLPFADRAFDELQSKGLFTRECVSTEVRNLWTKLLQRIAMVLLRPRLATWRYRCGVRNIAESLKGMGASSSSNLHSQQGQQLDASMSGDHVEEDGEDDEENSADKEIPYTKIESTIGHLLTRVHDRDNVVRWTAAKGLARVATRLPLEMASEVVSAVIDSSFLPAEPGASWHGGCLALAELCRRGCLLPEQIPSVMSGVLLGEALLFERTHTGFAVSVGVRDAACYICWAFARAYEPRVLRPLIGPLAGPLVCLALFDREVNIRRAASAAYQENVGRNDSFPQGILVLQLIDYAGVARIRHCYLELAVAVAQYEEYRRPMLQHLSAIKAFHWDDQIRELASDSLRRLVRFDKKHVVEQILPALSRRLETCGTDVEAKHGCFFAIAAILMGLHEVGCAHENDDLVKELSPRLFAAIDANVFYTRDHRTKGFVLMARALCRLIEAICFIGLPLDNTRLLAFNEILDSVMADSNKQLHPYAANAYAQLSTYYAADKCRRFSLLRERILRTYFKRIDEAAAAGDEKQRCASILPLAHVTGARVELLARAMATCDDGDDVRKESMAEVLLSKLIDAITDKSTPKWVYARAAAIETSTAILLAICRPHQENSPGVKVDWPLLIASITRCCDDYTVTTNGDIGRFARRAAVIALGQLLPLAVSQLPRAEFNSSVGRMVQRACEYIDDLRAVAASTLTSLLLHRDGLELAEKDLLYSVFASSISPKEKLSAGGEEEKVVINEAGANYADDDWKHARGFLRLVPLLSSPTYRRYALEGFVLSAGSISTWTSQSAFEALVLHLRPLKKNREELEGFLADLLRLLDAGCAANKDPTPIIRTFRLLLNERIFAVLERNQPDSSEALVKLTERVVEVALGRGKARVKCLALSTLGCLLQSVHAGSRLHMRCAEVLVSMLDSPYATLRETVVEQLFEYLSLGAATAEPSFYNHGGKNESSDREQTDEQKRRTKALELLTGTAWSASNEPEKILTAKREISAMLLR